MPGRSELAQPFVSYAIWNIPGGQAAVWVNANLPARTTKAPDGKCAPFCWDPTQPTMQLWNNGGIAAARQFVTAPPTTLLGGTAIPFNPSLTIPSSHINDTASIIDAIENIYEMGYFCHQFAGTWNSRTVTGSTNGTTTITLTAGTFSTAAAGTINNPTNPDVGSIVTGTHIANNAYIVSITDSTHAVLSAAATGTGSGITFTLLPSTGQTNEFPTQGVMTAGHGSQYGNLTGEGLTGAAAGSGMSISGGCFQPGEWTTAFNGGGTPLPIPHALNVNLCGQTDFYGGNPANLPTYTGAAGLPFTTPAPDSVTTRGYRFPAANPDGDYNNKNNDGNPPSNWYGGSVPASCPGALYMLPYTGTAATSVFGKYPNSTGANVTTYAQVVNSIINGSTKCNLLTVPGQILALTAATYGYYSTNNDPNSRITFLFAQQPGTALGSDGLPTEFQSLFSYSFVNPVSKPANVNFSADVQWITENLWVNNTNHATQYATNKTNYLAGVSTNYTGAGGGAPVVPFAANIGSGIGPPFIQQTQDGTAATGTTLGITNSGTALGSALGIHVTAHGATAPILSITDVNGNPYTREYSTGVGTTANHAGFTCVPAGQIASGTAASPQITITSSVAASIAYEFYEVGAPYVYQAQNTASGNSTIGGNAVGLTPTAPTDVQTASIAWPDGVTTISNLFSGNWVEDATQVGIGTSQCSLQSGGNISNSASAQNYKGTLSAAVQWAAGIMNFTNPNTCTQTQIQEVTGIPVALQSNWATPAFPTGAPPTSYTLNYYLAASGGVTSFTESGIPAAVGSTLIDYSAATGTPWTSTSALVPSTNYWVTVISVNANGSSSESARFGPTAALTGDLFVPMRRKQSMR